MGKVLHSTVLAVSPGVSEGCSVFHLNVFGAVPVIGWAVVVATEQASDLAEVPAGHLEPAVSADEVASHDHTALAVHANSVAIAHHGGVAGNSGHLGQGAVQFHLEF